MRPVTVMAMVLLSATTAGAGVRATVTPQDLAEAINKADARFVPYRKGKISPSDIRAVRCLAPDEEPTEFKCKWRQHVADGWVPRTTWLTLDANGWQVMDG